MGLVDRNQGDAAGPQFLERSLLHQPFGRDVQKPQTAITQAFEHRSLFIARQVRIEAGGGNAELLERNHLVVH
jgi:hypothetical protein